MSEKEVMKSSSFLMLMFIQINLCTCRRNATKDFNIGNEKELAACIRHFIFNLILFNDL